jgi:hypothetical protein
METVPYSSPRERSFSYKPGPRFLANEAFYAVAMLSLPLVIAVFVISGPWRYAAAVATGAVVIWAARRAFRICLLVTEDEVRITNHWKTHVLPWSEVIAVAMMAIGKFAMVPVGSPAIGFWRRGRGWVKAQATPSGEREQEEFQKAVMALAPPSVQALTPPPDLWAVQDKPRRGSERVRSGR